MFFCFMGHSSRVLLWGALCAPQSLSARTKQQEIAAETGGAWGDTSEAGGERTVWHIATKFKIYEHIVRQRHHLCGWHKIDPRLPLNERLWGVASVALLLANPTAKASKGGIQLDSTSARLLPPFAFLKFKSRHKLSFVYNFAGCYFVLIRFDAR